MPKTVTTPWDPAEHLETEEDMAAYLEAAFEEGDPALVAAALGDIARAKGMTEVAREAGLGRESLYKALSSTGNPELGTVLKVVSALGLRLQAAPARASEPRPGAGEVERATFEVLRSRFSDDEAGRSQPD